MNFHSAADVLDELLEADPGVEIRVDIVAGLHYCRNLLIQLYWFVLCIPIQHTENTKDV